MKILNIIKKKPLFHFILNYNLHETVHYLAFICKIHKTVLNARTKVTGNCKTPGRRSEASVYPCDNCRICSQQTLLCTKGNPDPPDIWMNRFPPQIWCTAFHEWHLKEMTFPKQQACHGRPRVPGSAPAKHTCEWQTNPCPSKNKQTHQ